MADNPSIDPGPTPSVPVAADEIAGVNYQRVKLRAADDGVAGSDVSAANPLPVVQTGTPGLPTGAATSANQSSELTLIGAVTETAPATDTASSGLNGRLQRAAQRLTTIIGLLPAALGQTTKAGSLSVTLASNQDALPITDNAGSLTVDGTVTANAGTGPFPVSDNAGSLTVDAPVATPVAARLSDGAAFLTTSGSRLAVDGSGVTQPVSGTVTANIGTSGSLALDATLTGGTQKSKLVDTGGTNVASVSAAGALKVDGSAATQPVSGTVTTTPPSNASSNVAQINGVTPLMGTGNTGTGSLRVTLATDQVQLTNALKVDGSAVTQPVSMATPTSGGVSVSRLLAGASTNATSVKASAGQVYGWHLANAAVYTVFLKLYNKASAPTVGSDTPFMTIPIPAGAAANVEFGRGIAMGTGIAFATTKLVADSDTTALVANDLVINLLYA